MQMAETLARLFHANQTDKAGQPYIHHVERVVANLIRRWPDATADEITAAWLHDVLEDCGVTADDLRGWGVSDGAVRIVEEVTRPAGTVYLDWIGALAGQGSLSAVRVKLADNLDNSDPARVAAIPEGPRMAASRYWPARDMLEVRAVWEAGRCSDNHPKLPLMLPPLPP